MQKFAMVFPGQGSQKLGMLSELAGKFPLIISTFREASEILDEDLWEIAQIDPNNCLDQTQITQPVLLTASVAIWRVWNEQQFPMPSILAGHSLGEYSALVCAQALSFADAINLVHHRGIYMQEAVPVGTGSMAAIIGLDDEKVRQVCAKVAEGQIVSPANFNSPGQTVIAGEVAAITRAMAACKEEGAKRVLELKVSVPSHCALMEPAAQKLAGVLDSVDFQTAKIPVIQNVNAQIVTDCAAIKSNLIYQLTKPVLWVDSVKAMQGTGINKIVECGAGKVLCGLIKRISPEVVCLGSDDSQSLGQARDEVLL